MAGFNAENKPPSTDAKLDDILIHPPSSKGSSSNIPSAHAMETEPNNDDTAPDPDLDLTFWQSVKKHRRIVYYSLGITSAILMYGYDYVIIGTISAMPSFQRDFGEVYTSPSGKTEQILPSLWLALWNFISPGLQMPGAILAGFFQDRFGRRPSLAVGSFLSAVGVAICFVSNLPPASQINTRRALFFVGKGLQGGAIGMVMATTQTYLSEILPPTLRGPVLAFFPIFTLLGQVIGAVVIFGCLNVKNGYTIAFGSQWVFSVVPIVMAFVVPESPTYLVRKGREEDAVRMQKRLTSTHSDGVEAPEKVVERIKRDIEHEKANALNGKGAATYVECFRGGNLKRTGIVIFSALIPLFFGLTLLGKASYFVQIVGMQANLSVIVLILGIIVGLLANIASMWVVDRFERRVLIMSGLGLATLLWGGMGVAGIWSGPVVVW